VLKGHADEAERLATFAALVRYTTVQSTHTLKIMKSLRILALALVSAAAAYAADPSGNWKWTTMGRGGNPQEVTAQLALKDGKLTGSVTTTRGSLDISDASFMDADIAFTTVATFGDNKIAIKYTGKLDGDTIKGSIERPGRDGGAPTKADWNATRVMEAKK
jgi:hypothetical protein